MRIAFLSSLVPVAEPRSGFAIANRAVVGGLHALEHDVTSIGFAQPQDGPPLEGVKSLAEANLENAHAGRAQKLRWAARAFVSGRPFAAAKLGVVSEARVKQALDAAAPDIVVVNSYQMSSAFPSTLERPFIYLSHNVESRTAAANARAAGSRVERLMYRRDAVLLEQLEADLAARARHVWCLTEDDRLNFDPGGRRSHVLPLVLPDAEPLADGPKAFDAVLIGTWTWKANAAGLRWFVTEIVPRLPLDMMVAIAGSVPDDIDLTDERIAAMGRVASADGFLTQGHVVPLVARGGTGVQLKTIEAFQRGLATVATGSAVRGIADVPPSCTVADEPEAFARALIDAARRGREGASLRHDASAWTARQRTALHTALAAGLAAAA